MLPETSDFSVEVSGIPNPIIYIGCSSHVDECSYAEVEHLKGILYPLNFNYENRDIEIRIKNESIANIGLDPRTNIHFMFGYTDLKQYKGKLNDFIDNGGTVFMLSNITKNQVEDGIMNETFGLKWNNVAASTTGNFYNPNVGMISYRIRKYFFGIGGDADEFAFTFNPATENQIAVDEKTIISDSNIISQVKVNELTHGRIVWFADYNHADKGLNNLTKAVVLWASGENYRMDPDNKDAMVEKVKNSKIPYTEASYLVPDYEVRLRSWNIFY
jgi:hypothetical protein